MNTSKSHADIRLLTERPRQNVVAEHRDLGSGAAVIVGAEVYIVRRKDGAKLVEASGVSTNPVVNALLRVGESNQPARLPKALHDTPLRPVGVLEFVEDDERVHRGDETANAFAAVEKIASKRGEEVEADSAFCPRQTESLRVLDAVRLADFLLVGELRAGNRERTSDRAIASSGGVRICQSARQTDQISVSLQDAPEEGMVGLDVDSPLVRRRNIVFVLDCFQHA